MTYSDEAAKLTRHAFTVVQLDLDNTISESGVEYHCSGRPPLGQQFHSTIPLNGYDPTPTKMQPGEGMPFLGSVRLTFQDFDFGERGTYFGKLLATNPYYLDRPLKVFDGFYDGQTFDWSNFKEKLYFIKAIDGPDSKGKVTVVADDILTLLDEDQAQVPTSSDAALATTLTSTALGITNVTDNTAFDAAGGIVKINDEYISYSGLFSTDSIIVNDRGQYGSVAATHASGDDVIYCFAYENRNVVDVIYDLIDRFSPIDASTYINQTDWNYQRDNYLIGDNVTGIIEAGDPIKPKINSLSKQTSLSVWWDDEDQLVGIKAIGPTVTAVKQINADEHILEKGETVKRDPSKAVTTIIAYYGRYDHSANEEAKNNYAQVVATPDEESTTGFGKDKIEKVFCPDIPASGSSTASKLISRRFSQRRKGTVEYKFRLDVRDSDLKVGDEVQVITPVVQDENGDSALESYLVVEKDQIGPTTYQYSAMATGFITSGSYRVIAPNTLSGTNYDTATDTERDQYGFIADNSTEQFSNADDAHLIL